MTSEPKAPMGVEEAVKRLTWMLGNAEGAANYDVLPDIDRDEASKDAAAFRVALAALAQPKEEGGQTVDVAGPQSGREDAPSSGERLRLLDLFCCAGGAGRGYADAGFEVVGVDIEPQPRYPFTFIQADALALPLDFLRSFDAIHASPPCQGYSPMRHAPGGKEHPRLIGATRALLEAAGVPWVIENVEEARSEMRSPVMLCGTSFGLGTQGHDLQRHRLFETSFPLTAPPCEHSGRPVVGVYGGHARNRSAKHGGRGTRDVWEGGHVAACQEAMGIDWMTLDQISEAIPPAYTRFIGTILGGLLAPTRKEGE